MLAILSKLGATSARTDAPIMTGTMLQHMPWWDRRAHRIQYLAVLVREHDGLACQAAIPDQRADKIRVEWNRARLKRGNLRLRNPGAAEFVGRPCLQLLGRYDDRLLIELMHLP